MHDLDLVDGRGCRCDLLHLARHLTLELDVLHLLLESLGRVLDAVAVDLGVEGGTWA